ncbi:MAG TPA: heterodisulfide reductase-related iron-sulfur binding cluster [Mycobacteriales bacterium]|nr:heterodisulfide reductase-related iron-sulfur binding cluster [Mycobacteriales bacterium]
MISQDLLDDCVHCGFCLPTCPTYLLWGEEMDSPRGRIHLMQQYENGAPLAVRHFDACLGCLACVPACPSGVQYNRLIEQTRAEIEWVVPRPRRQRLGRAAVFAVFPHPRRLRLLRGPLRVTQALRLDRLAPASVRPLAQLAPPVAPLLPLPPVVAAAGERRAVVGLLTGCVQSVFFSQVLAAAARVLAAEGVEVRIPPHQGCCGALSVHTGRAREAARFRARLATLFRALDPPVDTVVVTVAGCGSALKEHGFPARDVTEVLADLPPRAVRAPLPLRVAYQDACHLAHAQGVRAQPRALLAAVPELEIAELAEPDICCGSAGVYNLLQPAPARALGERKARVVLAAGVDAVVTGNPGCALHLRAALRRLGADVPILHTVEVLDASIRGLPPAALTGNPGPRHPFRRRRAEPPSSQTPPFSQTSMVNGTRKPGIPPQF